MIKIEIKDLVHRQLVSSDRETPPIPHLTPSPPPTTPPKLDKGVEWWMSRPADQKILMNWDWLY